MTEVLLTELRQRVRPALACLGELGHRLLDVVTVIERLAGASTIGQFAEPAFALDVLAPIRRGRSARWPP
jgi:hypothetical protein